MSADATQDAPHSLEQAHIRPDRGLFDLQLDQVWRYRELLVTLVMRDVKVLYRQAALGVAWAVLQPIFAVTIFSLVFGRFARIPSEGVPYPVFAYAALLPWTYFAEALRRSASSLISESELVRKVFFPRLVIPIAAASAPLVDFMFSGVVFVAMLIMFDVELSWRLLAIFPLLLVSWALALGMGLWLAPINVKFRDIKHTLPFVIQVWMYASPVIYPLSMIPEDWKAFYSINPMVGVIEGFRWAAFGHKAPDQTALLFSAIGIAVLLAGGLVFFKRMERHFADLI